MKDLMNLCEEKNSNKFLGSLKLGEVEDIDELSEIDNICKELT